MNADIDAATAAFSEALKTYGRTATGDGYSFALGAMRQVLNHTIERLPPAQRADMLAQLGRHAQSYHARLRKTEGEPA